jgi:hypothetical protein
MFLQTLPTDEHLWPLGALKVSGLAFGLILDVGQDVMIRVGGR